MIPGLGLFGFGKDKREARITSEFFVNAIHVMSGANAWRPHRAPTPGGGREGGPPQARHSSGRRLQELRATSRCRDPKRSRSSIGRSRKPSCNGCRPSAKFSRKIVVVIGGASAGEVALQIAKRSGVVVADMNVASAEDAAKEAAALSSRRWCWRPRST